MPEGTIASTSATHSSRHKSPDVLAPRPDADLDLHGRFVQPTGPRSRSPNGRRPGPIAHESPPPASGSSSPSSHRAVHCSPPADDDLSDGRHTPAPDPAQCAHYSRSPTPRPTPQPSRPASPAPVQPPIYLVRAGGRPPAPGSQSRESSKESFPSYLLPHLQDLLVFFIWLNRIYDRVFHRKIEYFHAHLRLH
jgi:hypothetical protein